MARPKKCPAQHKDVPVKSYWSDSEFDWLKQQADAVGLSVSAYIRSRILAEQPERSGNQFAQAA
jgi:lipoate synthase